MATETTPLIDKLAFLRARRGQDETVVLAEAMQAGIAALYREALIEAYLLGQVPREQALAEVGPEDLADIDYQRDALRRDVAWGGDDGCAVNSTRRLTRCSSAVRST